MLRVLHRLPRLRILLRSKLVEDTPVQSGMLDGPTPALGARILRLEVEVLRLDLRGERVA